MAINRGFGLQTSPENGYLKPCGGVLDKTTAVTERSPRGLIRVSRPSPLRGALKRVLNCLRQFGRTRGSTSHHLGATRLQKKARARRAFLCSGVPKGIIRSRWSLTPQGDRSAADAACALSRPPASGSARSKPGYTSELGHDGTYGFRGPTSKRSETAPNCQ